MEINVINATVATPRKVFNASLNIRDGIIEEVILGGKARKDGYVFDANGLIVMPAFSNGHTHIAMSILRNLVENAPLMKWLNELVWPKERELTKEDIYYASILSSAELIREGIAIVNDMYIDMFPIAKALETAGLRGVLAYGVIEDGRFLKESESFIRAYKGHSLIFPASSAHAIYSTEKEALLEAYEISKKYDVPFHIHVSETREELIYSLKNFGKRPVEYLHDLGLTGKRSVFAHVSWVSEREVSILADSGTSVAHCPVSNMKLATGAIAPISLFYAKGVRVVLATDGPASNNSLSMIYEMRTSALLQKLLYWDATKPPLWDLFESATANFYSFLGLRGGKVEEGFLADLLFIDPKENMLPTGNVINSIVYSMKPTNIHSLMVGGEFLLMKGEFVRKEFREELDKAKKHVVERWL